MTLSVSCVQRPLWRHSGENSCSSLSRPATLASACPGFGTMCPVLYNLELFVFVPENESYIQMPSWLCFPSSHMPFTTLIIAFLLSCHERVKNSTPYCDWSFIATLNCLLPSFVGKNISFQSISIPFSLSTCACACTLMAKCSSVKRARDQ